MASPNNISISSVGQMTEHSTGVILTLINSCKDSNLSSSKFRGDEGSFGELTVL